MKAVPTIALLMWFAGEAIAGPRQASEIDEIYEAAFRYMFNHNASSQQKNARVYCLSVGGEAPSAVFLSRFADLRPPIRKATDCIASIEEGVLERETGARGLQFRIDEIRNRTETTAEIVGGYYEGGLSSSGNVYFMEKIDGRWLVVEDVMEWIS